MSETEVCRVCRGYGCKACGRELPPLYKPQTGDRVSLTGTVGAVIDGNVYVALDGGGSAAGAVSVYPSVLTLIERPEVSR